MMGCTDRFGRYFMRLLTRRALLYTEMVSTPSLVRGPREELLEFHPREHPVALQLGGSDPDEMALCARWGEEAGYDEVNVNVGCPSQKVSAHEFGACLMARPERVAECVAAMRAVVRVPVTVKTRIGIDETDSYEHLFRFVSTVAEAGCSVFSVHARKAWLSGLNPKQNRTIPPLRYEVVHRLKQDFPHLTIVLNGGLCDWRTARGHLEVLDGVMVGRRAYDDPYSLATVDRDFFGDPGPVPTREQVIEEMLPFIEGELARGTRLSRITIHMLGLFKGVPGARVWRRLLSDHSAESASAVREALEAVAAPVR